MPRNLVLVRHGLSEGNVAAKASRDGNDSYHTPEFKKRHSSKWRLMPLGITQAQSAGEWLRKLFPNGFERYFVSNYLRAMETAAHLDLPSARWRTSHHLREIDWGELDTLTHTEMKQRYPQAVLGKKDNPFYWSPPGGESKALVTLRVYRMLDTLHRECSDLDVVMVLHGDLTWMYRFELERMSEEEYFRLDRSRDPKDRLHNCQILQYTRINPVTGKESAHLDWMRSVCPWDTSLSSNEWVKIERRLYSNEELLAMVEHYPRLVEL